MDRELVLIHVIFRHGERTPDNVTFYRKENKSNYNEYYPYGIGQLTNKGKKDMHELGKYLRGYYNDFLGEIFLPKHVDAWSSAFDRTKASLMLTLAGLFPPKKELIWCDELIWQPIPTKYTPVEHDRVLLNLGREEYREVYNKSFNKSVYGQKLLEDYKEVLSYVKEHTGLEITNTFQVFKLSDLLIREKMYNNHPEWATDSIISKMREMTLEEMNVMMSETLELKKLLFGPFLQKIVHDSMEKIQGRSTRKIHMYSGHDFNVISILNMFQVVEPHLVEEGACVVLELYSTNKGYEVEIKYKRTLTGSLEKLSFPDGKQVWPFEKLEEILKSYGLETSTFVPNGKIADRVFLK